MSRSSLAVILLSPTAIDQPFIGDDRVKATAYGGTRVYWKYRVYPQDEPVSMIKQQGSGKATLPGPELVPAPESQPTSGRAIGDGRLVLSRDLVVVAMAGRQPGKGSIS